MTKRTFIALNLPRAEKAELEKFITQLKQINSNRLIKYVKTRGLHITLHFLGALDQEQIKGVKKILKVQAGKYTATKIISQNLNAFPNLRRPKVIILNCYEPDGQTLSSFQINLGQKLEQAGLDVDHRHWHPHITLARIKAPIQFKIQGLKIPQLELPITSVELMESELNPDGAEYKIIESFQLKH